jgi:hypothetical protein
MTQKGFDPERAGPSATDGARQEFMSASEWFSTNRRRVEPSICTEVGEFRSPSITEQLASTKCVYDPVGWQVSQWRRGYEHSMSVPISGKRFVCHIPEGKVAGVDGAVITPDGVLLTDVSLDFPTLLGGSYECHSYAGRVNRTPTRRLTGTSVVLALLGGNNYFHWMAQLLPRLFLVEKAGLQIANVDHFIVNGISHPFQRENRRCPRPPISSPEMTSKNFRRVLDLIVNDCWPLHTSMSRAAESHTDGLRTTSR